MLAELTDSVSHRCTNQYLRMIDSSPISIQASCVFTVYERDAR